MKNQEIVSNFHSEHVTQEECLPIIIMAFSYAMQRCQEGKHTEVSERKNPETNLMQDSGTKMKDGNIE